MDVEEKTVSEGVIIIDGVECTVCVLSNAFKYTDYIDIDTIGNMKVTALIVYII